MTAPQPQVGAETAREYVAELVADAERARQAREREADLGHDYEGREVTPGTPEYDQMIAEYGQWVGCQQELDAAAELEEELDL